MIVVIVVVASFAHNATVQICRLRATILATSLGLRRLEIVGAAIRSLLMAFRALCSHASGVT